VVNIKEKTMSLTIVEKEYLRLLKPQLADAIRNGEPDRAASFARELARLKRKKLKPQKRGNQ
jgi:hypothetical protein